MDKIRMREAAKLMGYSYNNFRRWYKIWGTPYYVVGNMIRFSPSELIQWSESKSHNKAASREDIE